VKAKAVSCGVLVTDGERLLLGHATRSPRWDIPKGVSDPGETQCATACRELREETGLEVAEAALRPIGLFQYLRDKDLALFVWCPPQMPDPAALACSACFDLRGAMLPEFDRFGLFAHSDALRLVGKNMARVLSEISLSALCGVSG
jgi:8-oxo-dGTP pyrophosphatase MutT (NUDIX family)